MEGSHRLIQIEYNHKIAVMRFIVTLMSLSLVAMTAAAETKYSKRECGTFVVVENEGGRTIGYTPKSGVAILECDGYAFKDLNRNQRLDRYEDWRLSAEERAKDLAMQLPLEYLAGLMVHSSYQLIPSEGTYGGKSFKEANVSVSALDDEQYRLIRDENVRHLLVTKVRSAYDAAVWSNNLQALCESEAFGIPANNSTNPRTAWKDRTSVWGPALSLAATFDSALVARYGEVASEELRAMGIATLLAPQVEIATEPRWMRVHETFGESSALSVDLTRAYINGFQSSHGKDIVEGAWGMKSVNAMAKHWPGSGTGESGRDAHYAHGKYSVFPGKNFEEHLLPFTEGALKLGGGTEQSASIMVAYNVLLGVMPKEEQVGAGYSYFVMDSLLRKKYGYDGVICSDWRVPNDYKAMDENKGKPWGVEHLSIAERYLLMIMAGNDQIGGILTKQYIEEAYRLGVKSYGEEQMRKRYEKSAERLLVIMFRMGLFDNPYLDVEQSRATVNSKSFAEEALMAQMRSVVMLKNSNGVLPLRPRAKVYIPTVNSVVSYGLAVAIEEQFDMVTNPDEADYALVVINSPKSGKGYSQEDVQQGGNGYVPISLQYGEYKAVSARKVSLSGGDPMENFTNRTYRNKSVTAKNADAVDNVIEARRRMGQKPVIVCVSARNPMVFSEIEPYADAILMDFGVQTEAVMGVAAGVIEPQGLLPLQMPKDMHTVERQKEDLPFDMECYKDADGNVYDFAYGLNWSGVIKDWRTEKYSR